MLFLLLILLCLAIWTVIALAVWAAIFYPWWLGLVIAALFAFWLHGRARGRLPR